MHPGRAFLSIIDTIVEARKRDIARFGHTMGTRVPVRRTVPLVPFGREPFIISEIKRRSPSSGEIAPGIDARAQAKRYVRQGIKTVSVLTERNYFSGSLNDLMQVKRSFPRLCVLRKDFIIDEEDIEVSCRAGADAVLLIAKMHDAERLKGLYLKAKACGLEVLCEIHDENDLEKAGTLKPAFTGINSRNLEDFSIDPKTPVMLRRKIHWETRAVFESGIQGGEDVRRALESGFSGILAGESVMRDPNRIYGMTASFFGEADGFWRSLFLRKRPGKPLVKVCGITNRDDARYARECGADVLGFVFADSPRRVGPNFLEEIYGLDMLKAGVVVTKNGIVDDELIKMLEVGLLDALQLHGDESPEVCKEFRFPYYKALRVRSDGDLQRMGRYSCPRVLADAYSQYRAGGTGERIPEDLVERMGKQHALWLAGGIGPENVRDIVMRFGPELIDASSGLESEAGKKDHAKIGKFFREIESAAYVQ